MANYFIAGRAEDVGYATAERLADCMQRLLPDAVLTKFMLSPAEWPAFLKSRVRGVLGTDTPATSPVVWDVSGRLIGSHVEFAELCRRRYGITIDVTDEELAEIALANAEESAQQQRQRAIRATATGRRALLIVDVQNDFCEGGALEVPDANAIVPVINSVRRGNDWDLVVLTQDWHPAEHTSFSSNHEGTSVYDQIELPDIGMQVMWPDHCVQGDIGADFHPYLDTAESDVTVRMGTNPKVDSYSAFGDAFGGKWERTELAELLRKHRIDHVFIAGLAYDFCISFTAKDAVKEGFSAYVIEDASAGIADSSIAKETAEMKAAGVQIIKSGDLPIFHHEKTAGEAEYKRVETGSSAFAAANKRALIIVDVQNDFCDGGSLEVPDGSAVVPVINELRSRCDWDLVVLTKDNHPADHCSFASNNEGAHVFDKVMLDGIGEQTMWPDHCVQGSLGASFHADLLVEDADVIVAKGQDRRVDSYSGFGDSTADKRFEKTQLDAVLKENGIRHVYCVGLATDFCVSFTALDATALGYHTYVVEDATRGLAPGTIAAAKKQWNEAGVEVCFAADVPAAAPGLR